MVGVAVKPHDESFRRLETAPYRTFTCPCVYIHGPDLTPCLVHL